MNVSDDCIVMWISPTTCHMSLFVLYYPIGSMYGIFTYIWLIFMVNVAKYTIHGYYGYINPQQVYPPGNKHIPQKMAFWRWFFFFSRWEMLVPWRVSVYQLDIIYTLKGVPTGLTSIIYHYILLVVEPPLWKILYSQNGFIFPKIRVNKKTYLSCHHLSCG